MVFELAPLYAFAIGEQVIHYRIARGQVKYKEKGAIKRFTEHTAVEKEAVVDKGEERRNDPINPNN